MRKNPDYILRKDADFNNWLSAMVSYVTDRCQPDNRTWNHIPDEKVQELQQISGDWSYAYKKTLVPHIPSVTSAKNTARKAAVKFVRAFVQQFLMFPPVTDEDRINMRIHNRDTVRTAIGRPVTRVVFTLSPDGNRRIRVDFWDEKSTSKAKPYGYEGVIICSAILDKPPESYEELTRSDLVTNGPRFYEYAEKDRGKHLYMAMYWVNGKGEAGPWSDIQGTVIP